MFAITRKALPQIGQPRIGSMLIDQPRNADSAVPVAAMTFDFEPVELALKLAEGDRSAKAHASRL